MSGDWAGPFNSVEELRQYQAAELELAILKAVEMVAKEFDVAPESIEAKVRADIMAALPPETRLFLAAPVSGEVN